MNLGFISVGLGLVTLGVLNFWKPSVLYWINDRTNGWWAQAGAKWLGRPDYLQVYERNRHRIRFIVPVGLVVIGVGWILSAL